MLCVKTMRDMTAKLDLNDIKIIMQCVFMCQGILNSNQSQEKRKYLHIYYPSHLKKNFQFSIVYTSRKIAYTKPYRT